MGKPLAELNMITIHLGNGCSMTAVENGVSVDTSLGLTPLEGLVMGTRSGDIDPAIHCYLTRNCDMDIEDVDSMLNKQLGLKGLYGMNDMRDIHEQNGAGNERARLVLEVQTYHNRKYIGAFMAVLGRVDAIVLTAGIGENDKVVLEKTLAGLEPFGISLDPALNDQRVKKPQLLSPIDNPVQVWVIPTNEELAIGRDVKSLLTNE
jgi:acetate kinase